MDVDVVVVGAGVVGLTTAVRLLEQGARVLVVAAEALPARTSALAAAVWYPTGIAASPEGARWAADTYTEFARQATDGVPGVTMGPCRMFTASAEAEIPWWGRSVPGLRRLRGDEAVGRWSRGWAFDAPTVEMPVYLSWLADRFMRGGGTLFQQRVTHPGEAAERAPVVVNAAGLGAGKLCGDDSVSPVRGQLMLVANPGLRTSIRVQDHPEGYTYIHPRSEDVVLGGTFDVGRSDTTPDPATARAILRRCTALVPELSGMRIIRHAAGLRPVRADGVRLEPDDRTLPGRRVIHNYGHGGAGVTLSWGCADAAAALTGVAAG